MSVSMATQTSGPLRVETVHETKLEHQEVESGYASATDSTSTASSSTSALPRISLTKAHLNHLNSQMENMDAMEILRFSKVMFPNLFQSTAFGLTGLVTIDMLSKIQTESPSSAPVDLIFLDTHYHFQETHDLVSAVQTRYPNVKLHIYKPHKADTLAEFEATYGDRMYEKDSELYDWTAKVEPLQRAYEELGVAAILTGRRRSQGGARDKMPIIEVDDERGVIKINPLASWSFAQVRDYVKNNNVPYNALLDRGYKSVGDWHSTSPVAEGEDERAGRWKGQQKTECGIHNKKSRYAQYLEELAQKEKLDAAAAALEKVEASQSVAV
ncbi:phosphoadenosine phosphosulfate reductase [Verticillium alfalfae VaMs.102]|uniref:phosphoadenylyl-sulfate reductase (thioredoxin) n=1 Tax=Verticillium alfalfae (strain VaMs.102 / ATCC MYA-4576 / FGSC 10136) TaxID=526221 RepID=C9SNI6_VERA1|nr:phosphoadenosine phosphosulfate reductase [Verticillium alfalfae VaMs.102]EEY20351.1 phosphoadenosine phosphosulfate reductase [Verticillium alfalfae VaMs.102]